MRRYILLITIFILAVAGAFAQDGDCKCIKEDAILIDLSEKGIAAYNDLRKAQTFETGRVGFAGTISKYVIALNNLIEEKRRLRRFIPW